jgi:steroid delta-isomerase-like uncharacterized protein
MSDSTSDAEAVALVREYIEVVWNGGDADAVDRFLTPDFVSHDPVDLEPVQGREGLKQLVGAYRAAFPDLVNTIHEQFASDGRVVTRWSSVGTHQGPAFGLPATGRERRVSGIQISRVENGQIAEDWHHWDTFGMLCQLGAITDPRSR